METKKNDTQRRWMVPGLIAFLVLSVIFLNVMVLRMQNELDGLHQGKWKTPLGAPVVPLSKHTDVVPVPDGNQVTKDRCPVPFDADSWRPFAEMQRMQQQIEQLFADSFGRLEQGAQWREPLQGSVFSPDVDVDEKADKYIVRIDLPGVDSNKVDVQVDGRNLTVSGKRDDLVTTKDSAGHVVQQERRTGSFSRSIELPEAVDAGKLTASDEKGVFTIVLPKISASRAG